MIDPSAPVSATGEQRATAVAALGRRALEGVPLPALFAQAVALAADAFPGSGVALFRAAGDAVVVEAATGLDLEPGTARPRASVPEVAFVLAVNDPVEVPDVAAERRFEVSSLIARHHDAGMLLAAVRGVPGPWGVLAVTRTPPGFDEPDLAYVRSIANVLAAAILRAAAEEELRAREAEARLAFEVGRVGAWQWHPATNAVQWTPEMEAVYGIAPGEFEGTFEAFISRMHPDDRQAAIAAITHAAEQEIELHLEHRAVRPDGAVRWLEGRGRPMRGPDGRVERWIGVGIDVTERREAYDERNRLLEIERSLRGEAERVSRRLEEAMRRLDAILATAPAGFAFFDPEHRCVRANPHFLALLGIDDSSAAGRTIAELLPGGAQLLGPAMRGVLETGDAPDEIPLVVNQQDVVVRLFPLERGSESGEAVGIVVVDVSPQVRAERAERLLREVSEALASTLPGHELLDRLVRIPVPDFADCCTLTLLAAGRPRRVAVAHRDPVLEGSLRAHDDREQIDLTAPTATALAMTRGMTQFVPHLDAGGRRTGVSERALSLADEIAVTSVISVPIVLGGATVGAMTFLCTEPSGRRYTRDDVAFAEELARRCALAIERSQLAESEAQARARVDLLARAGEVMALELATEARLQHLASLVVPSLADVCLGYLLVPDGLLLAAAADRDPARQAASLRSVRRSVATFEADDLPVRAARSRSHVVAAAEAWHDPAPESVTAYDAWLGVPLLSDGQPVGALLFGRADVADPFTDADVRLARELARRAATAVVQARRFERERETAEVLQRSLLPQSLPGAPGAEIEARYLSGTAGVRVGGDWYDAVELDDGRLLLVIGDVVGHGVQAAALMGQMRTAVRLAALDNPEPGSLMTHLNRYLVGIGRSEMATCCAVLVDPERRAFRWSSAGHPPAVVRTADGDIRWLAGGNGPPLGTASVLLYGSCEERLAPGATLVLYTDGLVERRGEVIDEGLTRLATSLAAAEGALDAVCDQLIGTLVPGDPADDVALLAFRASSGVHTFDLTVPAGPGSARDLVIRFSEWIEAAWGTSHADGPRTVLEELVANVVQHAYGLDTGDVRVRASLSAERLRLSVRDWGRWRPFPAMASRGGMTRVRRLASDLHVLTGEDGTEVRVTIEPQYTRVDAERGGHADA